MRCCFEALLALPEVPPALEVSRWLNALSLDFPCTSILRTLSLALVGLISSLPIWLRLFR